MKCINHPERDAVASCKTCGKSLCSECANRFGQIPYCLPCEKSRYVVLRDELKRELKKLTAIGIIFMVIGIISFLAASITLFASENNSYLLLLCLPIAVYAYFSIPFGWATLDKITANLFLFLPIIGWLIYFVVKFILAFYVGVFTCPFIISKRKKNIKDLDKYLELLERH